MKLLYEKTLRGEDILVVATLFNAANAALTVKASVGVGKPYYVFDSITGVAAVDFAGAPIASADLAVNQQNIDALLAAPPFDKITFV
jgi:hypothetical protein